MKPFWFAFNTAAWLSSKSVRMMSLAERGAYIGLLATAWGEDQPGTLPAAEDFIRRLSEMSPDEWKVSGPVILAMFPLADCGTYRYNPRLLDEAGKREELSEKKAEAGRRSAAKRAGNSTDGQHNANTIPTGVEINPTGVDENGNQLQPQSQQHSSKEEQQASSAGGADFASQVETPQPESPAEPQRPTPRAPKLFRYDNAPVFLITEFFAYLTAQGYGHVDKPMYLQRIQEGARKGVYDTRKLKEEATNDEWKAFILRWLDGDKANKRLLLPDDAPRPGYGGPNPALQVTTTSTSYSPAAIAARNVTKY